MNLQTLSLHFDVIIIEYQVKGAKMCVKYTAPLNFLGNWNDNNYDTE